MQKKRGIGGKKMEDEEFKKKYVKKILLILAQKKEIKPQAYMKALIRLHKGGKIPASVQNKINYFLR